MKEEDLHFIVAKFEKVTREPGFNFHFSVIIE